MSFKWLESLSDLKCFKNVLFCLNIRCHNAFTLNDRINVQPAYLKIKAFGWVLIRIWAIIKKQKIRAKSVT